MGFFSKIKKLWKGKKKQEEIKEEVVVSKEPEEEKRAEPEKKKEPVLEGVVSIDSIEEKDD